MKKIFTLTTALLLSVILFAQSKLTISAIGNADIRVMVDGMKYSANGRDIVITNLKNGNHTVKIFRAGNERSRGYGNGRGGNYQLVYNNMVFTKPQYHVDITINRFGRAFMDEQRITDEYYEDDNDWGVDNNDQYYDNYNRRVMDKANFDQLKQAIARESFDNTRLKMAKQMVSTNYFNTAQVKDLLSLFSFDESKLELAKFAYDFTADKGNYLLLSDAFAFSSSKDALLNYISGRK